MNPTQFLIDTVNQRCYDNCYQTWDRFPFPSLLPQLITHYHNPSLGMHALDIGSGTGQLAYYLKEKGFNVLCLDPSPQMVRLCRLKGLMCHRTTFQNFYPRESFSLVLAILSLIHIPKTNWPAQLDKIASILPSGGLFLLALIEGKTEGIEESASGFPRFFAHFTHSEILQLTQPQFNLLDFKSEPGPQSSYLIYAFRKK